MRLTRTFFLALVPLALSACGAQSNDDAIRTSVSNIASVLQTYDNSRPTSVKATGAACGRAWRNLQSDRQALARKPNQAHHAAALRALRQAYRLSEQGFSQCLRASRTLDYPLMVQADQQFAAANQWIERARRLDR